jgi:hypothetical protein
VKYDVFDTLTLSMPQYSPFSFMVCGEVFSLFAASLLFSLPLYMQYVTTAVVLKIRTYSTSAKCE